MSIDDKATVFESRSIKLRAAVDETEYNVQRVLQLLDRGDTDRAKLLLVSLQSYIGGVKQADALLAASMFETPTMEVDNE